MQSASNTGLLLKAGLGVLLGFAFVLAAPSHSRSAPEDAPFVVVLGVAQDAGYPQAGCRKPCCQPAWADPTRRRHVVCLGIVDPVTKERWMVEATPDFRRQLRMLDEVAPPRSTPDLAGILLTHGHIGHYTGLMFVGHESMGAKEVPVYGMPRMRAFLSKHGPWDQLVRYRNIVLRDLTADQPVALGKRIKVTPFLVPHRDEYTEVVGFRIEGPSASVAFIPDIDKWARWDRKIEDLIAEVDVAYLDGTFYADGEIPERDMASIPHPFISESLERFGKLPPGQRARIRFIHMNHTNPALRPGSEARRVIETKGLRVAQEGERVGL